MGAARAFFGKLESDGEPSRTKQAIESLKSGVREAHDNIRELSGVQYPRTERLSSDAADEMVRHASASVYANRIKLLLLEAMDKAADDGSGKLTPKDRRAISQLYMDTFHEQRMRHAGEYYRQLSSDLKQQANKSEGAEKERLMKQADEANRIYREQGTFIGAIDSELGSEKKYQEVIKSPEFAKWKQAWKENVVPILDDFYRKAQGIDPETEIDHPTQIPGEPLNFMAVREGKSGAATSRQGDLRNPKLRKYAFANQFTGLSSRGYNTSVDKVIENSIDRAASAATKASMVRTLESSGLAKWVGPGERAEFGDKPGVVFPDVNPPKGTQANEKGQMSLSVHPDIAGELKKALRLDKVASIPLVTPLAKANTGISLASIVEGTTHIKNIITMLGKPGMRPHEFVSEAWKYATGNEAIQKKIAEMASEGSMRDSTDKHATLFGKYTGISKMIDIADTAMRLAADKAYDRNVAGGAVDSPAERRNFTNQIGNYNRATQNVVVNWLRDTGMGPFAVAATNYTAQGIRGLALNPGFKSTSTKAALMFRANMAARAGAMAGILGGLNYLLWGSVFGDDKTPIGCVKIGSSGDGKTISFDLGSFTGLPRGARSTGLLALIEGLRVGSPVGVITKNVAHDVMHAAIHPFSGPFPNTAVSAFTGSNAAGIPTSPDVHDKKFTTNFGDIGKNQQFQNVLGAIKNMNPMVAAALSWNKVKQNDEPSTAERVSAIFGPFVKFRKGDVSQKQERREITVPVKR